MRAFRSFENDICIESILRSQKKLESAVSALIMNDSEKIKKAKFIYYSNLINYCDLGKNIENKFLRRNKCLEFFQSTTADQIEILKDTNDNYMLSVREQIWNLLR